MIPENDFDCASRLAEMRWPAGFECVCGGIRHRRISTRPRVFVCRACTRQKSVTAGTLMHGCHVPLQHWFLAAKMISRRTGVSAREVQRELKVSYETAWQLLHRLRAGMRSAKPDMVGDLVMAVGGIRTSRPYRDGGPRRVFRNVSWVVSVVGTDSVVLGQVRRAREAYGWANEELGIDDELTDPGSRASRVLRRLWAQVQGIHCGVSERWLPRYMAEREHRTNNGSSPLLASLMAPRHRFVDLRPEFSRWPSYHTP